MRSATLLGLLLVGCAMAGCAQTASDDGGTTTTGTPTPTDCSTSFVAGCKCPPGQNLQDRDCVFVKSWAVMVEGDAGITIAVPLPHGSQCLSPDDWEGAQVATHNADVTWRHVDDDGSGNQGHTMWVVLDEGGDAQAVLNTTAKPTCNTFRYDPWSLDPDPPGDNLTVLLASGSGRVAVHYTEHSGDGCATGTRATTTFTQTGWTTLPTSTSSVCV